MEKNDEIEKGVMMHLFITWVFGRDGKSEKSVLMVLPDRPLALKLSALFYIFSRSQF